MLNVLKEKPFSELYWQKNIKAVIHILSPFGFIKQTHYWMCLGDLVCLLWQIDGKDGFLEFSTLQTC